MIEFTVNNLDGKDGETGTFVVKTHPEWAPIGAERFEVNSFAKLMLLKLLLNLIVIVLWVLIPLIRHWLLNLSLMDAVYFCKYMLLLRFKHVCLIHDLLVHD